MTSSGRAAPPPSTTAAPSMATRSRLTPSGLPKRRSTPGFRRQPSTTVAGTSPLARPGGEQDEGAEEFAGRRRAPAMRAAGDKQPGTVLGVEHGRPNTGGGGVLLKTDRLMAMVTLSARRGQHCWSKFSALRWMCPVRQPAANGPPGSTAPGSGAMRARRGHDWP